MDKIRDESKVGKTIKIDVDKLFKDTETNEIKSEPDILENWANFKRSIEAAKRCIVITGAGISVSSGIPDFRSPDGLFEQLKRKYPKEVAKGQDLFDASLFRSPRKTQLFYNFMGELKQTVKRAECTPTHTFIKKLDQEGRLLRCYTQNIDNLEKLAGLQTSFCLNESKRKRRKSDDTLVEAGDDEVVVVDENPTSIDRELRQEEKDNQDESENKMDSIFKESHLEGKNELMKKFIGDTNAGITDNTNQSKSCTSFLEKFRKEVGEEIARCREKQEEYGDVKAKDESRSEEVEIKHEVAECQNTGDAAGTVGNTNKRVWNHRRALKLDKTYTKVVQLHGSLEFVSCTVCHKQYLFSDEYIDQFCNGEVVPCPNCLEITERRNEDGKRMLSIGVLRPAVVLYNEFHPQAHIIGALSEYDLRRKPDLLIVMGTSLKIPGVKRLVRELSKCVKASTSGVHKLGAAKSLLINCGTPTSFAGWDSVFDYFVDGPSDVVVDMLGCPIYSELANKPESRDSASQQRPKPKRTRSVKRKTLSEDDTENASSHDGSVKNNDGAGGDDNDDDDDIPLSLQTLVSGNSPYCEFDPSLYSNDTFVNLFSDATTLSDLYSSDFELLGSEL